LRLETLEDRRLLAFVSAVSYPVGTSPQAVVAADFNNDGNHDLATADYGGNTVSVLLGDGQGGFGAASQFDAGANPISLAVSSSSYYGAGYYDPARLAVADLNDDNKLDVVVASDLGVEVLLGNGDGTLRSSYFTGRRAGLTRWRSATSPAAASPTWSSTARWSCRATSENRQGIAVAPHRRALCPILGAGWNAPLRSVSHQLGSTR